MPEPLCLLSVHAHPDDEASKGAPTVARYAAEGVHTVLVCCTGGEEGDLHNPALAAPGEPFHGLEGEALKAKMAEVRPGELAAAAAAIGFAEVVLLGYRDSGMADSPSNTHPESFHMADFDEAVRGLVEVVRQRRPQVLLTYGDDHTGYPHPDHIRVHEISVAAFARAGDHDWYPDAGAPWQPAKLYYSVWSRRRMELMHAKMVELGLESPWSDERWRNRPSHDHRITTRIDIRDFYAARTNALLAHATQVDPTAAWWFGLPDEVAVDLYPWEDWQLARNVAGPLGEGVFEDDLFQGLR